MVPVTEIDKDILEDLEEIEEMPSYTYKIQNGRIRGYVDDLEAMSQEIDKNLNTERYENLIYSTDRGLEKQDLYGEDMEWVMAELEMRIKDTLTVDERINDVTDFEFDIPQKRVLHVQFVVETTKGTLLKEMEVSI